MIASTARDHGTQPRRQILPAGRDMAAATVTTATPTTMAMTLVMTLLPTATTGGMGAMQRRW
eukprot:3135381-Pyramimonas_sp.AAC.1